MFHQRNIIFVRTVPKTCTLPFPLLSPLKERKHFDVLETSGRNTIPGKDFSSNHNIYSPRNKHLTPPPRSSIPRQGWHGVSPFNLTILLPPSSRASRHVTKIYVARSNRDTQNRCLACRAVTISTFDST